MKQPTFTKISPTFSKKSPTFSRKSPTFSKISPTFSKISSTFSKISSTFSKKQLYAEFELPNQLFLLERIANGKVEGKTFGKRVHVVEPAAGGLVRRMKSDTEIEAEDEELHIIS